MTKLIKLTLREQHLVELQCMLLRQDGKEMAAYLLCGQAAIQSDPWDENPSVKYLSREIVSIPDSEIISHSPQHVAWATDSFVKALKLAQDKDMIVAIVHSHPGGFAAFSQQDDINEPDLVQLAQNRNGAHARLISLILTPDGGLIGRCWTDPETYEPISLICTVGDRIQLHYPDRGKAIPSQVFQRQSLAFGEAFNHDMSMLRVGIVGCGGTGSAVAMLLPRLGVKQIVLFDRDVVEATNLNRLHGATLMDAQNQRPKVEVIRREIESLGIGVQVKTYQSWISNTSCRDALKSCDVIFSCTDDHAGRLFLNRFAYFYLTPVFDLGLAIEISNSIPPWTQSLDGRVTTLIPGGTCLLCREVIDLVVARDEALKREQPAEYEGRKAEAYVIGEGNPSPAVVTFTTGVANMAVEELIHRLQGFRGEVGAIANRVRKFYLAEDRKQGAKSKENCLICNSEQYWGRGDIEPFLDQV
ncbi:UBA/THIF-type NAD/FAD binding protein (plasmid) [Thalassoporum mexicanum PCC 7367]|uniref:ThiF family adenylyltransferase n=1 Tax=Thalassoporum mexicanum TaxID=3457544 RepID=UPI00029FFD6A|nr:ThiF family adenylyltransferase [Pseudanabaena sp. PCC 7367]AFY71933.1 UBA/THIF-type NAD/FAD binding protein [Pseudanabaena sp. PCC 7367]